MNSRDRFGRYEIVRLLGRGAMGDVYLALDTESSKEVALKVVGKGSEPDDQDIMDAERAGAELQKRLSGVDRRVVAVTRYGEISGELFIEMEYIDGEDLSAILARHPVPATLAAYIGVELCEMLENLRKFTTEIGGKQLEGVVHGDLKPKNIRLNRQNHVKVFDFGIAKALSHTRKYTQNLFGSTAYSSPERLETQSMDSHSDLWSVGVLLYQMIAGRLPFDEPMKERLERRIRSTQPPPPLPDACPDPMRRIVFKMLAHDPARRYATALEVKEELGRFQRGEPVLAEAAPVDNDATTRTEAPTTEPSSPDRTVRNKTPLIAKLQTDPRRKELVKLAFFGGIVLVLFLVALSQINFWSDADRLSADIRTERVASVDDAWTRYQDLAKRRHLSILLWGARRALKKRLAATADSTINEYRNNDSPLVYEAQWQQARNDLARALELDPDDNAIKGKLRLCEGQVERIEATIMKGLPRQKKLNDAQARLLEAAELWKGSPDPYLGLARLYVYDYSDVDKAEEALKKATTYGYPMGRREQAQLADGYRRRADKMWRDSRAFTQLPDQEKEYLTKARQDYLHAEELYRQLGSYGDSPRNELAAIQGQQRVEERLGVLQQGPYAQ